MNRFLELNTQLSFLYYKMKKDLCPKTMFQINIVIFNLKINKK